jgi:hypothetical protein
MQMSKLHKKISEKGIWETKNRNAVHMQWLKLRHFQVGCIILLHELKKFSSSRWSLPTGVYVWHLVEHDRVSWRCTNGFCCLHHYWWQMDYTRSTVCWLYNKNLQQKKKQCHCNKTTKLFPNHHMMWHDRTISYLANHYFDMIEPFFISTSVVLLLRPIYALPLCCHW